VNSAGEIVTKFLNREQIYSQLLITITEFEKKLETLKNQNQLLKAEVNKHNAEMAPLQEKTEKKALEVPQLSAVRGGLSFKSKYYIAFQGNSGNERKI